jgi:excisionase family DNA binding protein
LLEKSDCVREEMKIMTVEEASEMWRVRPKVLSQPRVRSAKRLYTTEEAALYLGVSRWVLTKMLRDGLVPYVQAGKKKLIDLKDLDKWIEEQKTWHIA